MTEPCRTKCGTEIDYVREEFSDRVFFSIPIETNGTIHNCVNLQQAEFDLVSQTWRESHGGVKEIDVQEKLPELPPELQKMLLLKGVLGITQRAKLDYKSRAGYRHNLYEFHNIFWHLNKIHLFDRVNLVSEKLKRLSQVS